MKALTLTQPWATLVAIGAKRVETRSWSTNYRGSIAIHAAKGFPPEARELCGEAPFRDYLVKSPVWSRADLLPRGVIVAVADLAEIAPTRGFVPPVFFDTRSPYERMFGNYEVGRFAWLLSNVRKLDEPIVCKGALGLWEVPADIVARLDVIATERATGAL